MKFPALSLAAGTHVEDIINFETCQCLHVANN